MSSSHQPKSLPFEATGRRGVANGLPSRFGDAVREAHPLESHLLRSDRDDRAQKLYEARVMFGAGLAMRLASEDAMAAEVARLPGLPSSGVLRETVRGEAETIEFGDVLNLPSDRPDAPKPSLHERAEAKFLTSSPVPTPDAFA